MQRTFFIFFLLLTFVNNSFWTLQFQNESESYHLLSSSKEVVIKQSNLFFQGEKLNVCSDHTKKVKENESLTNLPFEHEDEDKDEVENESLIGACVYSLDMPQANTFFSANTVFSYDRSFFKIHFLDIFSPPPNC